METVSYLAGAEDSGARIDSFISTRHGVLTRSAVQRLCEQGLVFVNGNPAGKNFRLKGGEAVSVQIPPPKELEVVPQDIPLDIVFEDADLIVINKPKGMVVHPAPGNEDGTLVNALLHHCGDSLSGIGGVQRPGIVHRIDKDTSGLLVIAKTDLAHAGLSAQMKEHTITRRYHAIVYGNIKDDFRRIEAPIGRHPADRKKMCVTDRGSRDAATKITVLERFGEFTHIVAELETGRTHQIRVHMAYIGHPVAGDGVYGPKKVMTRLNGQCLHARTLGFIHPRSGAYLEFESPLPGYFEEFLSTLHKKYAGGK